MAEQSPDYKKLFLAAEQARKEEQRRREAAEQAQDKAEEKTRKTTLLEFLDACHNYLYSGLTDALMESDFALERHFTSLHTLKESSGAIPRKIISSKLDLYLFQRSTVDDPVTSIIERLYDQLTLRRTFGLKGLTPPKLVTAPRNVETRIAAYITEYKPPHKLSLGCIYEDTPRHYYRRLIAAVITQAFSYMVKLRVAHGCVCTSEAFVFLRIPNDPRTVHYFLSALDSDGVNCLHLTAVGQMLAFTLQALKSPPRSYKWRADAASQLHGWNVTYEDLLDAIPVEDAPSSEYHPPRHNDFLRMSPIQLRRRHTPISSPSCSSREGQSGQYYTQNCLLGLVRGGPLNPSCPNLSDDLDTDCKPLKSHGYTVAAKCTPIDFGIHVPVYLGNIDLETPYFYESICELVYMMFLSFGGKRISQRLTTRNRLLITKQVDYLAQAIYDLRVLHKDLEPRNILWNKETSRVIVINFEQAVVVEPRTVLGVILLN
ncbi:hypothetical protein CC80DRAFT_529312 [Byssothecium circinans]|uniref:Protein kinase domain-containing protein n=1 Tax=Byssothecium circinans TaxID=147558 RepID=A0A6A5TBT7_9PLEO|nr:hypothetical protein CC80DRAFT_529312 [Byssothecium circinans]